MDRLSNRIVYCCNHKWKIRIIKIIITIIIATISENFWMLIDWRSYMEQLYAIQVRRLKFKKYLGIFKISKLVFPSLTLSTHVVVIHLGYRILFGKGDFSLIIATWFNVMPVEIYQ